MKLLILFTIMIINSCASEKDSNNSEMIFTIDFQDFFERDTVTLQVNNCVVFEDLILTSDKSTGITSIQVVYNHKGYLKLLSSGKEKEINCQLKENSEYVIKVLVNGESNSFRVDLDKGGYLGFDKKTGNKLQLNQSQVAFEYD